MIERGYFIKTLGLAIAMVAVCYGFMVGLIFLITLVS